MALLGPSTDYTDKDFDSLLARCRNLIRGVFPEWTDEDVADFGNILVELFCHIGDVLTKTQDNQAGEAYIGRATQRRNMIALVKLLNFTPRGNTASLVDLALTCTPAPTGSVTIPARTRARTEAITDPVIFETTAEVIFAPGVPGPLVVTAENAEGKSDLFTSSGAPNQEIKLASRPFLDGSLVLTAGNGAYEVVTDFLDSTANDRHCTLTVDQNDRCTVRFGNGVNGAVPAGTITAAYKVGGGSAGRVEGNTVRRLEGTFTDAFGNAVVITCTNPQPSSTPRDRQSVDEMRVAAPRELRVLTRTVAREDYEINALRVPGVARALMLTSDQDPAIAENTGALFIVPDGGGVATQDVKDAVLEMVTVTYPRTLTFDVTVFSATYLVVNIEAIVYLRKGAKAATVKAAILAALDVAFSIDSEDEALDGIDFGYNLQDANGDATGVIAWSDVFNVIRDTTGVLKVDAGSSGLLLNGARADLPIESRWFPRLGTVTLINGDTSTPL